MNKRTAIVSFNSNSNPTPNSTVSHFVVATLASEADAKKSDAKMGIWLIFLQDVVRLLLENGANIGIKNAYEEVPVENILPETMESFLNEFCISFFSLFQH